jgi:hypothetical protein
LPDNPRRNPDWLKPVSPFVVKMGYGNAEIAMKSQADRDTIADEAVGQRHATEPPDFVREKEAMSPQEAVRRNATPPGPDASMSEKTAAALGERVGNAYADAGSVPPKRQDRADRPAAKNSGPQSSMSDRALLGGQALAQGVSGQVAGQPFMSLVAAFGLGFIAATVLVGHR